MRLGNLFSPDHATSLPIVVLCWIAITLLVGDLVGVLIAGFLLVTLTSAAHLASKTSRKRQHWMRVTIEESLYAVTYATFLAVLVLSFWPTIILQGPPMSMYLVALITLAPPLILFFTVIHALHHQYIGSRVRIIRSILFSVIKTGVALALLLGVLAVGGALAHDAMTKNIHLGMQQVEQYRITDEHDLVVLQDIKTFAQSRYETLKTIRLDDCILCSVEQAAYKSERYSTALIDLVLAKGVYDEVVKTYRPYQEALPGLAEMQVQGLKEELAVHEPLFSTERRAPPKEYSVQELLEELETSPEEPLGGFTNPRSHIADSPLARSATHAVLKTREAQAGLRAVTTIAQHLQDARERPGLLLYLYERRDIEEQPESKLIRYVILTEWLQQHQA